MKIDKAESERVGIKVLRKQADDSDKILSGNKKRQSGSDFYNNTKSDKFSKRNEIDD